jgi:hypothetical protein
VPEGRRIPERFRGKKLRDVISYALDVLMAESNVHAVGRLRPAPGGKRQFASEEFVLVVGGVDRVEVLGVQVSLKPIALPALNDSKPVTTVMVDYQIKIGWRETAGGGAISGKMGLTCMPMFFVTLKATQAESLD